MILFQRWRVALAGLTGWRRALCAMAAGACGALAMAPVDFAPALVVTFGLALYLLDGALEPAPVALRVRLRRAAWIGWLVGFGYFVAGLWWLGAAFLVDAEEFAWALPLGVAGLPAVLACFTAAGFALAALGWTRGPARLLALALGVGLTEWLRGYLFTGFPWNAFGMGLAGPEIFGQSASLVGLYGLTPLAVLLFGAPALLAEPRKAHLRAPVLPLALLLALAMAAFGALRLHDASTQTEPGVGLRLMQPNVAQDEKFLPENGPAILDRYIALSQAPSKTGLPITHLFWPESPFPFFLAREPEAMARIAGALAGGKVLVTGAARVELSTSDSLPGEIVRASYYNAMQAIGSAGLVLDTYDKVHLVPFGEYLPFSGLLERLGLRQFVQIPGGFEPGAARKLLDVPGLPGVAPLICYEALFPGAISAEARARAGLIVNVTNDGWFGQTAGPYQHLAQARIRAIEEGLPLVRVANTGVSALVDPYGRLRASLPLATEGVIDAALPAALPATFFARWPQAAPAIPLLLLLLAYAALRRR